MTIVPIAIIIVFYIYDRCYHDHQNIIMVNIIIIIIFCIIKIIVTS